MPRPKLAVLFEDASAAPMDIYAAAQEHCDLVWVLGWSRESVETNRRLLNKLGEVIEVDGLDDDAITSGLRALGIDGVITFTDPPQQLAAVIAGRLGLIAHSASTAEMLSDKMTQRLGLQANGVPVPRFMSIPEEVLDLEQFVMELEVPLPAVFKPRRGSGSRDAEFVGDTPALIDLLRRRRTELFILEEFLADRTEGGPTLGAKMSP